MNEKQAVTWIRENLGGDIGRVVDMRSSTVRDEASRNRTFKDIQLGPDTVLLEGPFIEKGHRWWRTETVDKLAVRIAATPGLSEAASVQDVHDALATHLPPAAGIRRYFERKALGS